MIYNPETVKNWAGDSQWRALRADFARFRSRDYTGWGSEGLWALALFRFQKIVKRSRPKWFWMPLTVVLAVVKKLFTIVITIDLSPDAEIGPGLLIVHGGQIRVHGLTRMGADCTLHQLTTISFGERGGVTIGDHVVIGCHTSIIGQVTIGDSATIGANSLVVDNVPSGATALGVPARIVLGQANRLMARRPVNPVAEQ